MHGLYVHPEWVKSVILLHLKHGRQSCICRKIRFFLNTYIVYRKLLTISVTVAFVERSFSKLKLIKSYLRSTMSQKRLSGLVILHLKKKKKRF